MSNLLKNIYTFEGKDVTYFVILKITGVSKIIADKEDIPFDEAVIKFCSSNTLKILENTKSGLWSEPIPFVAHCYYEEQQNN